MNWLKKESNAGAQRESQKRRGFQKDFEGMHHRNPPNVARSPKKSTRKSAQNSDENFTHDQESQGSESDSEERRRKFKELERKQREERRLKEQLALEEDMNRARILEERLKQEKEREREREEEAMGSAMKQHRRKGEASVLQISGEMWKLGKSSNMGSIVRLWKKNYFMLHGATLRYYGTWEDLLLSSKDPNYKDFETRQASAQLRTRPTGESTQETPRSFVSKISDSLRSPRTWFGSSPSNLSSPQHRSERQTSAGKQIDLSNATFRKHTGQDGGRWLFTMTDASGREHHFACATEELRRNWVANLERASIGGGRGKIVSFGTTTEEILEEKRVLFAPAPPSHLLPPLPLSPPDKIESKNDNKGEVWRERGKVVGPKTTRATIKEDNDVIPNISPPARRGLFEFDSDCADQNHVKQDIGSHVMDMVEGAENQDVDRNLRVNHGERDEQGTKDVLEFEDVGRERTASNEDQAAVVHLKDEVVFERVAGKKEHGPNVANIELLLDMHIAQIGRSELKRAEFKREVADDVMQALGSNAEKCHVKGIRAGSVIVDLEIELAHGVAPKAVELILYEQSLDPKSPLMQGKHTRLTKNISSPISKTKERRNFGEAHHDIEDEKCNKPPKSYKAQIDSEQIDMRTCRSDVKNLPIGSSSSPEAQSSTLGTANENKGAQKCEGNIKEIREEQACAREGKEDPSETSSLQGVSRFLCDIEPGGEGKGDRFITGKEEGHDQEQKLQVSKFLEKYDLEGVTDVLIMNGIKQVDDLSLIDNEFIKELSLPPLSKAKLRKLAKNFVHCTSVEVPESLHRGEEERESSQCRPREDQALGVEHDVQQPQTNALRDHVPAPVQREKKKDVKKAEVEALARKQAEVEEALLVKKVEEEALARKIYEEKALVRKQAEEQNLVRMKAEEEVLLKKQAEEAFSRTKEEHLPLVFSPTQTSVDSGPDAVGEFESVSELINPKFAEIVGLKDSVAVTRNRGSGVSLLPASGTDSKDGRRTSKHQPSSPPEVEQVLNKINQLQKKMADRKSLKFNASEMGGAEAITHVPDVEQNNNVGGDGSVDLNKSSSSTSAIHISTSALVYPAVHNSPSSKRRHPADMPDTNTCTPNNWLSRASSTERASSVEKVKARVVVPSWDLSAPRASEGEGGKAGNATTGSNWLDMERSRPASTLATATPRSLACSRQSDRIGSLMLEREALEVLSNGQISRHQSGENEASVDQGPLRGGDIWGDPLKITPKREVSKRSKMAKPLPEADGAMVKNVKPVNSPTIVNQISWMAAPEVLSEDYQQETMLNHTAYRARDLSAHSPVGNGHPKAKREEVMGDEMPDFLTLLAKKQPASLSTQAKAIDSLYPVEDDCSDPHSGTVKIPPYGNAFPGPKSLPQTPPALGKGVLHSVMSFRS